MEMKLRFGGKKVRPCSEAVLTHAVIRISSISATLLYQYSRQISVSKINIHFSFSFQKSFGYECGHSLKKEYNKNSFRNEEVSEDVLVSK